ncbi:MAG: response regulator transcription factor [Natronospirillum sp.]|uniref:response regulator n=1 Tax=Natronospirillum sp. TaxID=2812955 RepID=UPI0025D4512D|nr:response regulator transcription factor [Natronospirillum sp.]MCH8552691.1 response regulator transcription factor [Natronospirillum sp.]
MPSDTAYHILVADAQESFRDAIRHVIRESFADTLLTEAESLEGTLFAMEHEPDVDLVLLDLNMHDMKGLEGLYRVRLQAPRIRVVMVSETDDRDTVLEGVKMGSAGYINKTADHEQIREALQAIVAGQVYLPSGLLQ